MFFARAYPRETQEMVFDAHDRGFAFFKGACTRGIYDNMKTAVDAIFVGKERKYNRRFLQMCAHYLVEPVACTPASGWEKGQVENQVGLVRERFFTPRLRFKNLEELNAWLADRCIAYAKAHRHPEIADRPCGRLSRPNGPSLCLMRAVSTVSTPSRRRSRKPAWFVSTATNTRFRRAPSAGRSKSMLTPIASSFARTGASSANMRAPSDAARPLSTPGIMCRSWRESPGLRNGAPFKDWVLPAAIERVRRKHSGSHDGARQMVNILAAVLTDGLAAVEAACAEALTEGVHSADVILNILARRRDPGPVAMIQPPEALRLNIAPVADCARYDQLRSNCQGRSS